MYKWFRDCKTAEAGKQLYRELVRKFHPDNGGSGEEIKEINSEFKTWWERFKDIHTAKDGNTYKAKESAKETAEEFMEIIKKPVNTFRHRSRNMWLVVMDIWKHLPSKRQLKIIWLWVLIKQKEMVLDKRRIHKAQMQSKDNGTNQIPLRIGKSHTHTTATAHMKSPYKMLKPGANPGRVFR